MIHDEVLSHKSCRLPLWGKKWKTTRKANIIGVYFHSLNLIKKVPHMDVLNGVFQMFPEQLSRKVWVYHVWETAQRILQMIHSVFLLPLASTNSFYMFNWNEIQLSWIFHSASATLHTRETSVCRCNDKNSSLRGQKDNCTFQNHLSVVFCLTSTNYESRNSCSLINIGFQLSNC